jgi:nucleoside phosphorylase
VRVAPTPIDQSLIVHLFAPLTGPNAAEAVGQLRRVWRGCVDGLGMTEDIPAVSVPADPPAIWPTSAPGSLPAVEPVAARRRGGEGVWQAMWVRDHDVACVSVALSSPGSRWAQLCMDWTEATGAVPMGALLGVVEVYTRLVAGDGPVGADTDLATVFAADLPSGVVGGRSVDPRWPHRGVGTRDGFGIWQTTPRSADGWLRRLVILGSEARDPWLSAFAWSPGQLGLAPLTRYLLDAARLAYEVRVWQDAGRHTDLRRHAEATLDVLRDGLAAVTAGRADLAVTNHAKRHLAALRLIEAGLVEAGSLLTQLRAAVASWTDNMAAYTQQFLAEADADGVHGFAEDRSVAAWFDTQLRRDAETLAATRDRVHHYVELAGAQLPSPTSSDARSTGSAGVVDDASGDAATVVALTAIEVERLAVLAHLVDVAPARHEAGTVFHVGRLPDSPQRVAVAGLGAGNLTAAVLTERAIAVFRPRTLLFVGVAGGLHDDLALGDVVIATWIYAYHSGTEQDGRFSPRPRAWPVAHELIQLARHVAAGMSWSPSAQTSAGRPPRAVFRPVAAGEVVIDGRDTPAASQLREHYDDAAAVEMESAGAAEAAYLNGSVPILTIRGISDLASGGKRTTDAAGWQPVAAANAAQFARALTAALEPNQHRRG